MLTEIYKKQVAFPIKMEELEDLRVKFMKAYANLPEPERYQVVVIIDEKPHSWNAAYMEVSNNTQLGNKMLKKMKMVGIL